MKNLILKILDWIFRYELPELEEEDDILLRQTE